MDERCETCGKPIPNGRLEALPNTRTCVGCSDVRPYDESMLDLDGPDITDVIRSSQQSTRQQ